jgi:hypothetical protein
MFSSRLRRAPLWSSLAALLMSGLLACQSATGGVAPASTNNVNTINSVSGVVVVSSNDLAPAPKTSSVNVAPQPTPQPTAVPTQVAPPVPTPAPAPVLFNVRALPGGPNVRTTPSDSGLTLTGLYYDTVLPVYAEWRDTAGTLWYRVQLWGTLQGWIRADQTARGLPPTPAPKATSTSAPRDGHVHQEHDLYSLNVVGITNDAMNLRNAPAGDVVAQLAAGASFQVNGWEIDDDGSVWYFGVSSGIAGWMFSGGLDLQTPDPVARVINGQPIYAPINGKGMWLTVPLMEMANPDAIVAAARQLGLNTIYFEVGDTQRGFYGQKESARLLPAAHAAGIKVIGWVLTGLRDIPADLTLSQAASQYRAPSGDTFDGIAVDIEDNMYPPDVAAFSQILRSKLGPDRLIVGVIYPPGTWIGREHPIAGVLSKSFNALAPMSYWHEEKRTYPNEEVATFIRHSVNDIRTASGNPNYPVAVIAQTYDSFGRNGIGANNPTAEEINTALTTARDYGANGVSLFQWATQTPAEWDALAAFRWR